jgi:hypothetical protein
MEASLGYNIKQKSWITKKTKLNGHHSGFVPTTSTTPSTSAGSTDHQKPRYFKLIFL